MAYIAAGASEAVLAMQRSMAEAQAALLAAGKKVGESDWKKELRAQADKLYQRYTGGGGGGGGGSYTPSATDTPWYKSTTVLVLGGAALLGAFFMMRKGKR